MAYVNTDTPDEPEVTCLEKEIADYKARIAKKKAYIEFLKAHPEFEEYQRLKDASR